MCHGQVATENMPNKRSLDLSEGFCTEKALKKRPPPLDLVLLGAEAARSSCLKTLDLLGQNLILLPFLSLKDLKKFGCVNKSVQAFVGKYLTHYARQVPALRGEDAEGDFGYPWGRD